MPEKLLPPAILHPKFRPQYKTKFRIQNLKFKSAANAKCLDSSERVLPLADLQPQLRPKI